MTNLFRALLVRPRMWAWPLAATLFCAVEAAEAQHIDARLIPKGALRIDFSPRYSNFNQRFSLGTPGLIDGTPEPLGADLTTDSTGNNVFPSLLPSDEAIRSITGDPTYAMNVGEFKTVRDGDVLPVARLCRLARDRGVLTCVDGAQTFGVLDLDLHGLGPDFFTGSAHKWLCGPKEVGLLYVAQRAHDRIRPSIVGLYGGRVGISRTLERFGQRDDAAILALGEALRFQDRIGRPAIERRARELAQHLMRGLSEIDGIELWTSPDPARSLAVVSFRPASLDGRELLAALYDNDRIAGAPRGGSDRPGFRLAPHIYNPRAEVDRAIAAIRRYVERGI